MGTPQLGRVGIWSMELRFGQDIRLIDEVAAEIAALGYGALWIPGGFDDAVLGDIDRLISATDRIVLATGIINVWKMPAASVAAWWKGQGPERQSRVLLGLGVSHPSLIGESWGRPLATMEEYFDELDAAGVPHGATCLAALGPKMLAMAGTRSGGAHPYLVTPEHSALARGIIGPGKLLAPEQGVILETDPAKARALARSSLDRYRTMRNYRNSWLRQGFSEAEIEALDDRLVDGLIAWGSAAQIAERVKAHHAAGADHVCLQVVSDGDMDRTRQTYRELAAALL